MKGGCQGGALLKGEGVKDLLPCRSGVSGGCQANGGGASRSGNSLSKGPGGGLEQVKETRPRSRQAVWDRLGPWAASRRLGHGTETPGSLKGLNGSSREKDEFLQCVGRWRWPDYGARSWPWPVRSVDSATTAAVP